MEEGCHIPVRKLTTRGPSDQVGVRNHCRRLWHSKRLPYYSVLGGAQASYARYSVSDGRGVGVL
jgi:hypothetical protein